MDTRTIELLQRNAENAGRFFARNRLEIRLQLLVIHVGGSCLDHYLQPFFDGHLLSSICSESFDVVREIELQCFSLLFAGTSLTYVAARSPVQSKRCSQN